MGSFIWDFIFPKKELPSNAILFLLMQDKYLPHDIVSIADKKQYVLSCFRNYWVRMSFGQEVEIQISDHHNLFGFQKWDFSLNKT